MNLELPHLALYRAIKGNLTYWLAPGANLPTVGVLMEVRQRWEMLKPYVINKNHRAIDNGLALVERQLK